MKKIKFKYLNEYDNLNKLTYEVSKNKDNFFDVEFSCVCCGQVTKSEASYSNQGHNLICEKCANKKAHKLNISISKFLNDYIWRD